MAEAVTVSVGFTQPYAGALLLRTMADHIGDWHKYDPLAGETPEGLRLMTIACAEIVSFLRSTADAVEKGADESVAAARES